MKQNRTTRKRRKHQYFIQKLSKQKGGRIHDMETYHITCEQSPKEHTLSWLQAKTSLKIPSEAMYDEFVHVLQSTIKDRNIVVKIQTPGIMVSKEIQILNFFKIHSTPNIVPYICSFSCKDTISSWESSVHETREFCQGGPDTVALILLDYIPNSISELLKKDLTNEQFYSIIKQLGFVYIHTYTEYGFIHGDIHCGNILVDIDTPKTIHYRINDKDYTVETLGYEPMLLDFQRGMLRRGIDEQSKILSLQNDLSMLFHILSIQTETYKDILKTLSESFYISDSIDDMIHILQSM